MMCLPSIVRLLGLHRRSDHSLGWKVGPSPVSRDIATPAVAAAAMPPTICAPLYIYPTRTSWEPVFQAAAAHPEVDFQAIVNPADGPGTTALPDANYMSQLQRLSAYPNIKVLGYVHVSYGDKDNTVVERDIDTYWSWAANDPDKIIRIDGIFFDEAPAGPEGIDKMNGLATRVRSTERWTRSVAATNPASDVSTHGSEVASQVRVPGAAGADMEECSSGPCTKQKREATTTSRPLVVFNPGMPVDRAYYQLADYVVAFEQSYQVWTENQTAFMAQVPPDLRRKSIVILHTFPSSTASLNELVTTFASAGIGGQFVTEQAGGGYSVWWTRWDEYVNLVSAAAAAAPTGRTG